MTSVPSSGTTVAAPVLSRDVLNALYRVARSEDAMSAAWPRMYPGPWATAALVAEHLGVKTGVARAHLWQLVQDGYVVQTHPWPVGLTAGYQPARSLY